MTTTTEDPAATLPTGGVDQWPAWVRIRRALGGMPYGGALPCAGMTALAHVPLNRGERRRGDALVDADPEVRAAALELELEEAATILEALAARLENTARENERDRAELHRLERLLNGAAELDVEVRRRAAAYQVDANVVPPPTT